MNIAKKTPEAVVDVGVAEIRAKLEEELAWLKDRIKHEIDDRAKELRVALDASKDQTITGTLWSSEVVLVKDIEIERYFRGPVQVQFSGCSYSMNGMTDLPNGKYRIVLALIPLEKK